MFLEHRLDIIDRRLDSIEKTLLEMRANSQISVDEFEKVRRDIGMVDPVAMRHPRNKCNVISK